MTEQEDRPQTIDMTPTIYGEAHALASGMVFGAEHYNEDMMDDETKSTVETNIVQNVTEELVQNVMHRRALYQIIQRDSFDITQEDVDKLMNELIEEDDDERVRQALKDEEEE